MRTHTLLSLASACVVSSVVLSGCSAQHSPTTQVDLSTPTPTPITLVVPNTPSVASPIPSPSPITKGRKPIPMNTVLLKTSKGDIELELSPDKAPKTVANFIAKANSGYYVNLTFHRVEDWVIQGGDPLGNGTGGGSMPTELSDLPFGIGSLGVARGGDINVSNDSQFFICTKDCSWLNGQYTNFGKVTKGMDVVNKIAIGDKIIGIQVLK